MNSVLSVRASLLSRWLELLPASWGFFSCVLAYWLSHTQVIKRQAFGLTGSTAFFLASPSPSFSALCVGLPASPPPSDQTSDRQPPISGQFTQLHPVLVPQSPHLAHSTASSHALNRAVWPGGLASDGSAEPLAPSAYCAARRALSSGERIPAASCCSVVRNFLPNQRKT